MWLSPWLCCVVDVAYVNMSAVQPAREPPLVNMLSEGSSLRLLMTKEFKLPSTTKAWGRGLQCESSSMGVWVEVDVPGLR